MFRYLTAGESHGKSLMGIVEGLPSGLAVDTDSVNHQLRRRRLGYGRGHRMQLEQDGVEILAGVRHGKTLGSPVSFLIPNREWESWRIPMSPGPVPKGSSIRALTRPRPGHADLAGALKHQTHDARNILERASARETAARVAVGSLCRLLLLRLNIQIGSHVISVGEAAIPPELERLQISAILSIDPESALRCADSTAQNRMIALIDKALQEGDTLGGVVEVVASGVPPGLGSYTQWDRRLDGRLAQAMMSIPAVKAVEIGSGVSAARQFGSTVHDEIMYDGAQRSFHRITNHAGGLEGGVTNGADVRLRLYVKPIPTLRKALRSVDLVTKEASTAAFERSDTCVVPAAGVIGEAMLAIVLADAALEKFGGDSVGELDGNYANYQKMLVAY